MQIIYACFPMPFEDYPSEKFRLSTKCCCKIDFASFSFVICVY